MMSPNSQRNHSRNTVETILSAFPKALASDVHAAIYNVSPSICEPHTRSATSFWIGGENVILPSRVYFPKLGFSDVRHLNTNQRLIVAAIMTINHSGYQREEWAKALCETPVAWGAPFLSTLFGEYVFEILLTLEKHLDAAWIPIFKEFSLENPSIKAPLSQRIYSYWDIHHRRRVEQFADCPSYRLAARYNLWEPKSAPQNLRKELLLVEQLGADLNMLPRYQLFGLELNVLDISQVRFWVKETLENNDILKHNENTLYEIDEHLKSNRTVTALSTLRRLNQAGDPSKVLAELMRSISNEELHDISFCRELAERYTRFHDKHNFIYRGGLGELPYFWEEFDTCYNESQLQDCHTRFVNLVNKIKTDL